MGEKQDLPFQLSFNATPKVDFQGSRFTFDGGLILVRELDERLGLGHQSVEEGSASCLPAGVVRTTASAEGRCWGKALVR